VRRAIWLLALAPACTPTLPDDTSIVSAPRLLAVKSEPPEAAPGAAFTMTALYAGPEGAADASGLRWATCTLANPLGDPDPINPACFVPASSGLLPIGERGAVSASILEEACTLFGPQSPPPMAGQPAARPTDPDTTGGFYLPVRVETPAQVYAAALERVACQPAGLVQSVFTAFTTGYVPNTNPGVSALAVVGSDGHATPAPADGAGTPLRLAPASHVTLQVSWPSCPATVASCAGAETYLLIDPTTHQIATQRESMVAAFYATGGAFDVDSAGRDGTDTATDVTDGWTAPSAPGAVHLWVVLRDARGGVGWESYTIAVGP
jgi:hypothetical protein